MAVQTLLGVVSRRAMGTQTPTGRHSVSATCSVQTEQKLAVHAEMQVDGSTRDDLTHSAVIEELQSRSETQLSELQAKNTKLRDLQRAKSSLELKIRQLESERDQLQASRKDLSNQLKTADRKMKALGSANRDIQASMEKSTKEHISVIMAMQNEIAELEKQVKELGKKLAEKTEEHIATQRVVDMFKVEVRKWQGEARKVQQRQVQLVSCSREHELEQERYAAAFKAREEMKDKFRDYNAMHEVDQRCLRKEIAQLKQERDRMRGQHAEESHRSSKLMSDLQDSIDGVLPQKTVSSEADAWLVEQLDSAVEEGLVERGGPVSGSQAQQHSSEVSALRAETAKLKSELDFTKERCKQESENARMYTSLLEVNFLNKFCLAGWMLLRTPSWRRNGID
ncbi:M protein, serotype 24 precursor, putative [Perkinsus marinus ATCC 50983]|uniref:M protein, serotype 24, putative n=1 Tax=Perkinsus marinus (strain ATCC 50983 / TXsc) TaxID=423536 RepID=C5L5I5_PERM5|nr:M protein, serotype 24 precursor, putative [Perkinsus marinus ATCC 50983]EER08010.1 M protein, serotype 24 precursor, putative [Perkinsus marinus ATCC 50983]|eukprot:XP_002776194.1 M protein, serotype 24 precursor, putative [Perkinsus marinus ATCC 50983]